MSPTRVQIGRITLDLRGLDPQAALGAAQALGPALQRALADRGGSFGSAARIDAGTLQAGASSTPGALAASIAARIAGHTRHGSGR